jgi:hypothetical protein
VIADFRDFRFTWNGFFRWTGITVLAVLIAAILGTDEFRRLAYDCPEPHASIGQWRN